MNKRTYWCLLVIILLVALFFRFYNFPTRLRISADDARDIMAALGAVKNGTLPLIGSFSSAGPFVFGPLFYWFLIACYSVVPKVLVAPYIALIFVDILLVYIMARIGKIIGGRKLALITGLFSAISTSQLFRSGAMTQHTFVSIATALTILFFLLSIKKKKNIYVLLMGVAMGIGISMHYQAINLLVYGLVIFLIHRLKLFKIIKSALYLIIGLAIPSLPLLYWDGVYQNWANITNLFDYLLLGQYRIWVSNRWLTYAGDFWPNLWAKTIGGEYAVGVAFMIGIALLVLYSLVKRKLKKEILWLGIIFAIQVVLNRYYRGERFEGYMLYFLPLILIFSAWFVKSLLRLNKWLGILFLIIVFSFTLYKNVELMKRQYGYINKIKRINSFLVNKYPGRKFAVYDFYNWSSTLSQPLSLFFYYDGLSGYDDVYLGVTKGLKFYDELSPILEVDFEGEFEIFELNEKIIEPDMWINVNQDYIYQDMYYWWKERPLTSSFSIIDFLKEKLRWR